MAPLIDSTSGKLIFSNFKFQNNKLVFSSLLEQISIYSRDEITLDLELTRDSEENFINFFFQNELKIIVIKSHLRKTNIRNSKNDWLNSIHIVKALLFGEPRFVSQKNLTNFELKKLTRFRKNLIKQQTRIKIQLTSLLNIIFPEFQYIFKSKIHKYISISIHISQLIELIEIYV